MKNQQTQKYEKILKTLRRYRREGWELKLEDEYSTPKEIAKARAVCEDSCDYMPDFIVDPQTGHKFINHNFVRNECWNKAPAVNSCLTGKSFGILWEKRDLWISDETENAGAVFRKPQVREEKKQFLIADKTKIPELSICKRKW